MTTAKKPAQEWRIGAFSPKKSDQSKHYILPPQNFAPADKVCNASSREPLVMSQLWTSPQRPNSDHSEHQSVGWGC